MSYLLSSADNRFRPSRRVSVFLAGDLFFLISSCSADTCVVQKKLLLVVNRYELLDVSQFVVQIFTADLFLLVVRIRLERTNI